MGTMMNYHSLLGDSNRDLRYMNEAMGDMEYTVPYIKKLMNDPVARVGWDPSRTHTAVWPDDTPHDLGSYIPQGVAPWKMNNSIFDQIRNASFLSPTSPTPGNIYTYPSSIDETWPYNDTVLHESRHRGYDMLGIKNKDEELINRYADVAKGDVPIRKRAMAYLGEHLPQSVPLSNLAGKLSAAEAAATNYKFAPQVAEPLGATMAVEREAIPQATAAPQRPTLAALGGTQADAARAQWANPAAARDRAVQQGTLNKDVRDGVTWYSTKSTM